MEFIFRTKSKRNPIQRNLEFPVLIETKAKLNTYSWPPISEKVRPTKVTSPRIRHSQGCDDQAAYDLAKAAHEPFP